MVRKISKENISKTGIYQIKNLINDKIYIGSSKQGFAKRFSEHLYDLKNNDHHSQHLQKAYNKYGKENFIFEIIEVCNIEIVVEREQYWIDLTKCYKRNHGYNILQKAYSSEGYKHSEESLKKIGEQSKKRGAHPNSVNAMKKANTGRKREKAHSERMSKLHSKPVVQLSLEGVFIKEWESIAKIISSFGLRAHDSNISKCCKGKCKSYQGFIWVAKEEYDPVKNYEYNPIINGYKLKYV